MARRKPQAEIGIIGGSGLYAMEGLERIHEIRPGTPFGRPSDALILGVIDGVRVAFLARHGRGHRIGPSEINYRANIYALKSVGVTRVISVSAVGSMKEALRPGQVVLPDQFVDQTRRRASTLSSATRTSRAGQAVPRCWAASGLSRGFSRWATNIGIR